MSKHIKTASENAAISKKNAILVEKWKKNGIPQSAMLTPIIDKDNWAIINNSIIGLPFQIPYGCANTTLSHCQPYANINTVSKCKEACKSDPLCEMGNFIEMNNKTYCIPYANISNISKNMSDSIWNLYSNYQSKNIKSSSFLNYNLYSPWNSLDYDIFYGDRISIMTNLSDELSKTESKQYLGVLNNKAITLDTSTSIQLVLPGSLSDNSGEVKIKNYNNVMINIYGTYLVLQQQLVKDGNNYNYTDELEWFNTLGSLENSSSSITIVCLYKQPSDFINYDDTFVFIVNNKYICSYNNKIFCKTSEFLQKNKTYKYQFKINPEFTVSYCNNSKKINFKKLENKSNNNKWAEKFRCNVTSIDKCVREDNDFYYIGENNIKYPVYRGQWCYGICRDDGSVQYTNRIPLLTEQQERSLVADQLIISISILIISYILFMILK